MFYGVDPTTDLDDQGMRIYQLTGELRGTLSTRVSAPKRVEAAEPL
jgi:hypothetical protein